MSSSTIKHVIVQQCFGFTKLLRGQTATNNENLPILTLSPRDENNGFPFPSENKKTQACQIAEEELFSEARNFK